MRLFNITVGQDLNGDLQLTDRPAFAAASLCGTNNQYIKCTKYGDFNLDPVAGDTIIPRNYGRGPGSFTVNLRLSKTWGFGEVTTRAPRGGGGGDRPRRRYASRDGYGAAVVAAVAAAAVAAAWVVAAATSPTSATI